MRASHPAPSLVNIGQQDNQAGKIMRNTRIGFIGGGNMAASLIGGLVADNWSTDQIYVAEPDEGCRESLSSRFSIHTSHDNHSVVMASDILVLAVKPQVMRDVTTNLAEAVLRKRPLVVSIAAGVRMVDLSHWLGDYLSLVRCMPNTPAQVGSGATALYADPSVDNAGRDMAETVMRAVGLALWVDNESQIDAVTALSGSGPAYFFYVMEAMEQAGIELGLSRETARLLTLQTAFGASKMALESSDSPRELRKKVTSPGGTTESALTVLKEGQFKKLFAQTLNAACERSKKLATKLGQYTDE